MPPLPTLGSEGMMFSSRPAVCFLFFHYQWRDFNETCLKYSPCEWEFLKMFSRSQVKGQDNEVSKYVSSLFI